MNDSPEVSTLPIGKFQCSPEQRAQWVERFCDSGLSLREFSAQHGLGYMSLWRWVRKAQRHETSDQAAPAAPAFTEIKLAPSVERADWVAELSLPNGKVLRLAKDVPAWLLEQLLQLC